jgi:hypothetical protein
MAKNTPEQHFRDVYNMANDEAAAPSEREKAEREWRRLLKRRGKTTRDIGAILLQAEKDDEKQNPPSSVPDPRMYESVRYDPERHNPVSLVESLLKLYVTMSEDVRVIYALSIVYTHVYDRFSIVPRIVLKSRKPGCGKSIAELIARRLVRRPNNEGGATGGAFDDHYAAGPGTMLVDEIDPKLLDADALRRYLRAWNYGYTRGPNSNFSKMIGGVKQTFTYFGPMYLVGVDKGIGRLLARQQRSRTIRLEMESYVGHKELKPPPEDYYHDAEIDDESFREAFNTVYTLVSRFATTTKLNHRPEMPEGIAGRDADNLRGYLSVADACGPDVSQRVRKAFVALLEQQGTGNPEIVILQHAIAICDMLGVKRIEGKELDSQLYKCVLPGMDWRRYRGLGGDDYEHPLTNHDRIELMREHEIDAKPMRFETGRGGHRGWGYEYDRFVGALRKRGLEPEPMSPKPQLRLVPPASD